ncbi:redoxin domain-containing protein [Silicimonas algicola]|uniref:Peroxiredoxin n=1 Tax=Silicimonas algicola TaxID=1826607 RepID=A0A316GAY6_9RHOB|nr:redoxin domain-containing protein [Silicimonas algicola]AZQ67482.1 redoxin domain-containing protein [Silicimonas algicola]PWK57176.1 peroxiredoxin [Silicimonas algicola]
MQEQFAPGTTFPDFVLPDHTKTKRRLSDLQGDQLMVLFLTRGFFCPKDRQHVLELVRFHPQMVVGYTQAVTITTDDWHTTNNYRQQTAAPWPFLYDEDRVVQKQLDINEYTDTQHDVMIPHTVVLGRDLRVHKVYNGYYYWGRPSMSELHSDLRDLARQTYEDWDITKPALRKKWDEGDMSHFYPYGDDSVSMHELMLEMAGAIDQYAGKAKHTG